jgi:hypothetical protein
MGQDVAARVFSRADRQRYREKVRVCLDVFARMLAESRFEPARGSFGLEIELNLTGDNGTPAMANAAVLEAIADPDFQTELYNDHGDVAEFISLLDPERSHCQARRASQWSTTTLSRWTKLSSGEALLHQAS